jgi:hypothetical protein
MQGRSLYEVSPPPVVHDRDVQLSPLVDTHRICSSPPFLTYSEQE